jgi:hypothetical protein
MTTAFVVWVLLVQAQREFSANMRERGWQTLQIAEQKIPLVETDADLARAQAHADRVWTQACAFDVRVAR